MEFLVDLMAKYPVLGTVFMIIGVLCIIAQVVIVITPTKKDDEWLDKNVKSGFFKVVWDFFLGFAPIGKSSEGLGINKKGNK